MLQQRITRRRHRKVFTASSVAILVIAAGGSVAAAQINGSPPAGRSRVHVTTSATSRPHPRPTSVALKNGYPHSERFCASRPMRGALRYVVHHREGTATLRLRLRKIPVRNRLVGVGWQQWQTQSDGTKIPYGYTIASFRVDANGRSEQSSLRIFRAPFAHGRGLVLDAGRRHVRGIARLVAC